jgi:hypothetical protein
MISARPSSIWAQEVGNKQSAADHHSSHSSSRAKVLEHLFIGELLRTLWCHGVYNAEVLRSEVDDSGYDIVVECNGILRHIQLKSSRSSGKASYQKINRAIESKPSGCVVWIVFQDDTLSFESFLWFGGPPGQPIPSLGDQLARHTKGDRTGHKGERANIRKVNKGKFRKLKTMRELAQELFGDFISQNRNGNVLAGAPA